MHHLGVAGYRELVATTITAARRMADGIRAVPGLRVLGEPEAQIVTIAAAALACYLPARRAAKIYPIETMRAE